MTAHSQLAEPPVPQRRRNPVRRVLARMRERRQRQREEARRPRRPAQRTALQRRMRKRKAALALSAGVMGMSTAAMGAHSAKPPKPIVQLDNPLVRLPAGTLHVSEELKDALVQEEGVRDVVYLDVAGYPTVGVGHLVRPGDGLRLGDRVSYDRIIDFLEADLGEAERAVARLVGDLPLFQHEFDALVDLVYNVGEGNVAPAKSPRLAAAIAAGDYEGIASELQYHYAAGRLARGLVHRSERRQQMFMNAAYEDPRAASPSVALAS